MTSRHRTRTATHAQRAEDAPTWTSGEPEAGSSRRAMVSTQRHNTEQANVDGHRKHRSKRAETTDAVAPSAPVTSHSKSSSNHRSSTMPSTSYQGVYPSTHATAGGLSASATSPPAHTPYYAVDTSRSHTKAKPSPLSSNERVTLPDDRSGRNARTTYPAMATVQAPSSTQYYVDNSQVAGETSSRHRRERDADRDKEREKQRRKEEKARARAQETESLRTKEKERDRERRKEREREAERAYRDRDGHRSTERTKEHERSRRKEERRAAERAATQAPASNMEAYRPAEGGERPTTSSARYAAQNGQPVHPNAQQAAVPSGYVLPGSSTNYYDPTQPTTAHRRPSDPAPAPMAVPLRSSERDKSSTRQHRSHRDRVAGQGSGQESGMSSSEQEQSLRGRYRPSERRHTTKERKDVYAPSGSETERESMRDRRKLPRANAEIPGHAKSTNEAGSRPTEAQLFAANYKASQSSRAPQPAAPPQDQSYRPTGASQSSALASAYPSGQPTVPVGLSSQRHVPQIVSIRAGQGPADPQTPVVIPKSSSSATVHRQHEQAHPDTSHHHEPHTYAAPPTEHASYGADTSKKSRHANPGSQPSSSQQATYGDATHANAYSNVNATSLHPVQQAIRSVEGIVRPPSTRPGGKTPSSTAPTALPATGDPSSRYGSSTRDYERAYAQKANAPSTGAYVQAPQQPHSTPQYSTSDVRLPGAYPSSPAVAPQPPVHPISGPTQGYGVPGIARTSSSQDEKTPRARPVDLSIQYQTSTYPHAQNGVAHDSTKMPSVFSPGAHSITVAQATFAPARPPSAAPDAKTQWSSASGGLSAPQPTRYTETRPSQDGHVNQQGVGGHSPGRQSQNHIGRSPGVASTAQLDATPRQYSSSHLPTHRNGSTDTIQQGGASKYSPSLQHNQQTLNHRTSIGSLQPHASSRPDMTPTARSNNVLSGYPEPPTRYRSPAPIPIPYRGPSSAPNPPTPASQPYNVQSPRPPPQTSSSAPTYDSSFMSPRGASATIAQPHSASIRNHQQAADYDPRTQDPYNINGQRPPRAAPPSTPSASRQQYDVTSPDYVQSVLPPSSAPPRSSTFPVQQTRRPAETNPVHPPSHSRAASEPHYPVSSARPPLAVQTNTAHIKSRSATHAAAAASEQDLLLTPSSLAPSMLPRQHSNASSFLPPGSRSADHKLAKEKDKDKDKERKRGGFFSLFRSRSNPPKPLQETAPDYQRDPRTRKRQDSAPAASNIRQEPASAPSTMRSPPNVSAPTLAPARQEAYETLTSPRRREHVDIPPHGTQTTPTPRVEYLTVPSAGMGVPSSRGGPMPGGRSPTKMFSPFRLLSKRHRTVSAASVEALDGTAGNMATGADSTRSSTAGRLSPPLRDPQTATQEWRNKEEADFIDRGTWRRRRPGVTFDVDADTPEKTTAPRAPSRSPRQRQPAAMQEQ